MKFLKIILCISFFAYSNFISCAEINSKEEIPSFFINKECFFEFVSGKKLSDNFKINTKIIMSNQYIIQIIERFVHEKSIQSKVKNIANYLTFLDENNIFNVLNTYREYLACQFIEDNKIIYENMGLINIWGKINSLMNAIDIAIKSQLENSKLLKKVEHYIVKSCNDRKHFISQNYPAIMGEYNSLCTQLSKNIINLKKTLSSLIDERERIKCVLKIEEPKQSWSEYISSYTPDNCKLQ